MWSVGIIWCFKGSLGRLVVLLVMLIIVCYCILLYPCHCIIAIVLLLLCYCSAYYYHDSDDVDDDDHGNQESAKSFVLFDVPQTAARKLLSPAGSGSWMSEGYW